MGVAAIAVGLLGWLTVVDRVETVVVAVDGQELSWFPVADTDRWGVVVNNETWAVDTTDICVAGRCRLALPTGSELVNVSGIDDGAVTAVGSALLTAPASPTDPGTVALFRPSATDGRLVGETVAVADTSEGWELIASPPDGVVEAGWSTMADLQTAIDTEQNEPSPRTGEAATPSDWHTNELHFELLDNVFPSGGDGVVVAVIDDGVDRSHPVFVGAHIVDGIGYDSPVEGPIVAPSGIGVSSDADHGTAVASLIVGSGSVTGIAPNATVLPIRAVNTLQTMDAIYEAVDAGADIINLSRGAACHSSNQLGQLNPAVNLAELFGRQRIPCTLFTDAVDYAEQAGVVVVTAAGNEGDRYRSCGGGGDVPYTPAVLPATVSVAAMSPDGTDHGCSTRHQTNTTMAPGDGLHVAWTDNQTAIVSGTSFAAPLVTGLIARVLADNPDLTPHEIRDLINTASSPLGGTLRPTGVPNALSVQLLATQLGLNPTTETPPPTIRLAGRVPGLTLPPPPQDCRRADRQASEPVDIDTGLTATEAAEAGRLVAAGNWVQTITATSTSCTRDIWGTWTLNPETQTGSGQLIIGGHATPPPPPTELRGPRHLTGITATEHSTARARTLNGDIVDNLQWNLTHWRYTINIDITYQHDGQNITITATDFTEPTIELLAQPHNQPGPDAERTVIDTWLRAGADNIHAQLNNWTWTYHQALPERR